MRVLHSEIPREARPRSGRRRRVERVAYYLVAGLFAAVVPFARRSGFEIPGFRDTVFLSSAFAAAATFAVLVALWRAKPRSALLVLAQAYALAFAGIIGGLLTLPVAAPYFFLMWHLLFAFVSLMYVTLRRRASTLRGPVPSAGWMVPLVLPAGISFGVLLAVAFFSRSLPLFVPGQRFAGGPVFYLDVAALLSMCGAGMALLRLRRRDYVDVALGLTLAGFAIELAFNLLSTRPSSVAWIAARLSMLASCTFVLIGTGMQLIATYRTTFTLRDRLRVETARSNERSRRMDALWTLARDPHRDEDRIARIIAEGATALAGAQNSVTGRLYAPNDFTAADADVISVAQQANAVRVWAQPHPSVAASFEVDRSTYVLHFARSGAATGFDADDLVFVQVLSTLCAETLEQIVRRERMQYQAEREMLTGLYNATMLRSRLVGAVRDGDGVLLTIRIANLRDIGRTLGRLAADAIVVEIAALLAGTAHGDELVARAADDTFGILMPGTSHAQAGVRVGAFAAAVDRSFDLGDRTGRASIDVISRLRAVVFERGNDAEAVLTQASFDDDGALESERVKIVVYDREHNRRYAERRDLLAELRSGIERQEIAAYYQPYISLASGMVIGAEALMRWEHPQRGLMEPHEFMGMAQEWGLMPALGASVIDRVFDDIALMRKNVPALRVYVNLDAAGFESSSLIDDLQAHATRAGVPLAALGVEITETTAMRDVSAAQAVMEALHRAEIAIALDDFGTGFSSLAYLKQYPVDVIKIDRSFVAGLPHDPFDVALVGAIVAVADAFGMHVHAEGVETPEQAEWLRVSGCTSVQGYYYARALPIEKFVGYTAIAGAGISAGRT